ncbi:MAG: hypothetical protein HY257_05960 [Chloroflexi bacterium]|nr:hypothetical protein [Chloroflexota bacterium]
MNKKALYVLVAIVIFGLLGLNAYVLFTRGTQVVSQGQKGGSPEASLTPTPLVSKSVPAALRPGLDKLGELYQGYPTLIAATSFQVVFRGRVQSYSGNTLVLADGKKALTLQLRDDTNVIVIVHVARVKQ